MAWLRSANWLFGARSNPSSAIIYRRAPTTEWFNLYFRIVLIQRDRTSRRDGTESDVIVNFFSSFNRIESIIVKSVLPQDTEIIVLLISDWNMKWVLLTQVHTVLVEYAPSALMVYVYNLIRTESNHRTIYWNKPLYKIRVILWHGKGNYSLAWPCAGNFEHPKQMFKLMDKKIVTVYRSGSMTKVLYIIHWKRDYYLYIPKCQG